jgi:hypothetical protein
MGEADSAMVDDYWKRSMEALQRELGRGQQWQHSNREGAQYQNSTWNWKSSRKGGEY